MDDDVLGIDWLPYDSEDLERFVAGSLGYRERISHQSRCDGDRPTSYGSEAMKASENKWLTLKPGATVVLTTIMEPVICLLDPWFEKFNHHAFVTSGKRTVEEQLDTVKKYARLHNVDVEFPNILKAELNAKQQLAGKSVYQWQPAWSRLLNMGVIIAPPIDAECLFDYYHPNHPGINKKGLVIKASEHYCTTDVNPFDIGGAADGVNNEKVIVAAALNSKEIPGMIDYLIERNNNCVHVRCRKVEPVV